MRYNAVMRTLTVRRVSPRLAEALERERRRRGSSLNALVLDVLEAGLGVRHAGKRSNGLARLAGSWSQRDLERFDQAVEAAERLDNELWR
jgi:hypothetical protein